MNLKTRLTHDFIEIKTDEIETTIHKSSQIELDETISNLLSVIEDLILYTDKHIIDYIDVL